LLKEIYKGRKKEEKRTGTIDVHFTLAPIGGSSFRAISFAPGHHPLGYTPHPLSPLTSFFVSTITIQVMQNGSSHVLTMTADLPEPVSSLTLHTPNASVGVENREEMVEMSLPFNVSPSSLLKDKSAFPSTCCQNFSSWVCLIRPCCITDKEKEFDRLEAKLEDAIVQPPATVASDSDTPKGKRALI
jgi:hypothetical protein